MVIEQLIGSVRFHKKNGLSREMVVNDGGQMITNLDESSNSVLKKSTNKCVSKINISKV